MHTNDIGFGFLCFGDNVYFKGTEEKVIKLTEMGFSCYILTDNPSFFKNHNVYLINYNKEFKSYSDKISIIKNIFFKQHNIGIIMDSDSNIIGYNWIDFILNYQFKKGITYIDTLINHVSKKSHINNLNFNSNEWKQYYELASSIYENFENNDLIWEYVLVFNKEGFKMGYFFETYSKLQKMRETIDVSMGKKILGAGEGISLTISCLKNEIPLQFDEELSNVLKKEIKPISLRYTPKNEWPTWMKE